MNILPIGAVDRALLEELSRALGERLGPVGLLPPVGLPPGALDAARGSFRAGAFLDLVRSGDGEKVLGVTEVDLAADGSEWVFGYAEVGGKAAVVSLHRLRSPDRGRLVDRLVKEAIHELGHTQGLQHCLRLGCVMRFSETLEDTDAKSADFCPRCAALLP